MLINKDNSGFVMLCIFVIHICITNNNDFITNWVSIITSPETAHQSVDDCAKAALQQSHQNCLSFPWIKEKVATKKLKVHLWFFDIQTGQIHMYSESEQAYVPLDPAAAISS